MPFSVYNAPRNKVVIITATVPGGTSKDFEIPNLCTGGTITLDASTLVVPPPGKFTGKVFEACFTATGTEIANTRRPLATSLVLYGYANNGRYVNRNLGNDSAGGYTFSDVPAGSRYAVYSSSPRKLSRGSALFYGAKTNLSIASGSTTAVGDFVFPMLCANVTGGS